MVRSFTTACAALSLAVFALWSMSAAAQDANRLDLDDPTDAFLAFQKMNCSLTEGETIIYWWQGSMMSRIEGERDRHLFNVQGMNIRQCEVYQDDRRGPGFRLATREIMLYLDPETNELLSTWTNPWTGEEVDVIHVANDPVSMEKPFYAFDEKRKPFEWSPVIKNGRVIDMSMTPLFYENPLGGAYQEYEGGHYHAMEMTTLFAYEDDLLDGDKPTLDKQTLAWARVSDWLPHIAMGGCRGAVFF